MRRIALPLTLVLLAAPNYAQTVSKIEVEEKRPQAPSEIDERVVFVTVPQFLSDVQLETTVYKPSHPGPWPLVVINHGSKGLPDPHQQERNRPIETARFFLDRGYLVVAPMREGFSKSTGRYAFNCDHADYALRYAKNIEAVIDYFVAKGDARADQVLVTGQSNGGMVILGYAASVQKAKGVINFAGGINTSRPGCDWRSGMVNAAKILGAKAKVPSLWIYNETDTIFPPDISRPFFQAYKDAGAPTSLLMYSKGGHGFSTTQYGRETWGPAVEQFMQQVGLPFGLLPQDRQ